MQDKNGTITMGRATYGKTVAGVGGHTMLPHQHMFLTSDVGSQQTG